MTETLERIPVPGGSAVFRQLADLTPRQTRKLDVASAVLLPLVARIAPASEVRVDGVLVFTDPVLDGPPVDLTAAEYEEIRRLNDLAVLVYLDSWTLDRPLPASLEEVRALPPDLYVAVATQAAKLAINPDSGFVIRAMERREAAEAVAGG